MVHFRKGLQDLLCFPIMGTSSLGRVFGICFENCYIVIYMTCISGVHKLILKVQETAVIWSRVCLKIKYLLEVQSLIGILNKLSVFTIS